MNAVRVAHAAAETVLPATLTPGGMVDVVLDAAASAGLQVGSVDWNRWGEITVISHRGPATAAGARALFAALGAARPVLSAPYGPDHHRQRNATGSVPGFAGMALRLVVTDLDDAVVTE